MKTTNERFDEQFLMKGSDCTWENPPEPDEIKTFISQEKNLLLDQAIEVLEKFPEVEPNYKSDDYSEWYGGQKSFKREAISKLKELKTN